MDSSNVVSSKRYRHRPLDRAKQEIRLLTIEPETVDGQLALKLEDVSLEDADDDYDAISYTWGTSAAEHPVFVERQLFYIRENASRFLWHCQRVRLPVERFWIDAICINQEDNVKKSWQVAMMDQIYSKACRTLVWLGEDNEDSLTATYIQQYVRARTEEDGPYNGNRALQKESQARKALDELEGQFSMLCTNPYWHRPWIVQEIVLARSESTACVIIGSSTNPRPSSFRMRPCKRSL